ncbi:hypothetical protein AcW1_004866 [Taiwanofungus camphoratus]|nr:hypothetical protein AcW1_004866 [Antrodia cinnamomea]
MDVYTIYGACEAPTGEFLKFDSCPLAAMSVRVFRVPATFLNSRTTRVTREARQVVRAIFASRPDAPGLSTQQIFQAALEKFPGEVAHTLTAPLEETKEGMHPLRSMRYLKKYVLEDMAARGEVRKVYVKVRGGDEDENGKKMDVIVSKDGERQMVPNFNADKERVWVWQFLKEVDDSVTTTQHFKDETKNGLSELPPKIGESHSKAFYKAFGQDRKGGDWGLR